MPATGHPRPQRVRTRLKANKEYDRAWCEVLSWINRQIAGGHRDPQQILASAWKRLLKEPLSGQRFQDYYTKVGICPGSDGLPAERIVVRDGAYRLVPFHNAHSDTIITTTLEFLTTHGGQVDCVVELGSGTGKNLFDLFQASRNRLGGTLDLHACELTESGREVTQALHRLSPDMDLSVHAFDYYEPDLSFLQGGRNVLFLTIHSIEQIPVLGQAVFDEMLERSENCSCLHFEPVGWQVDERLLEQRNLSPTSLGRLRRFLNRRIYRLARQIDSVLHTRLHRGFPGIYLERDDIGKPNRVSPNAAAWSWRLDYNKNLVSLLRTLEAKSRITIEREQFNAYGDNPFNPTSVILWTKKIP